MTLIGRFGTFIALAALALGQDKPKDVDGWGKIKWGVTTFAQARAAYGIQETPVKDANGTTGLEFKKLEVGNIILHGWAYDTQGNGKITALGLLMSYGLNDSLPSASAEDLNTLRTLLTQKYGPPVSTERGMNDTTRVTTILWTFPSTSILLTLHQGNVAGHLTLEYKGTDKKALGVL